MFPSCQKINIFLDQNLRKCIGFKIYYFFNTNIYYYFYINTLAIC